ncbi:MAG TPA: hypothetical protein VGG99_27500 [Acetobacteraceae bacterium]|jgi:hypothetical protein
MTQEHVSKLAVPPALAAQIVAAAEVQHRPPLDVLHDAVADYLTRQPLPPAKPQRSPAEAATRMRRARAGNPRLSDAALRELMTHGRA